MVSSIESNFWIYALQDNFTKEIRYIGKTSSGLKRIKSHFRFKSQEKDTNKHKTNWLRSINNHVEIIIVQKFDSYIYLNDAEKYWIKYFREAGCPLVNISDGGEGQNWPLKARLDFKVKMKQVCNTPEFKKQLIDRVNSQEYKEKLSKRMKEQWKNPEIAKRMNSKKKNWLENHPNKEEIKRKLSKSQKGKKLNQKQKNALIKSAEKSSISIIDENGTIYKSISEASRITGIAVDTIRYNLKGHKSYVTKKKFYYANITQS